MNLQRADISSNWSPDKIYEIVKVINDIKKGNTYVYALVEDGIFDSNIYYPVALYSEMLWDGNSDIKTLQSMVALRDYVKFVQEIIVWISKKDF